MNLSFKNINENLNKKLNNFFPTSNGFIEVYPGRVILPRKYADIGESILNLPIYSDDIWLICYPRTGSTWTQEMIWLLGNNLDFEGAKQMLQLRSPIMEVSTYFSESHHDWIHKSIGNSIECVKNMAQPRFIRSHLPLQLLPKQIQEIKPKIIYTARNPKDLCLSYYYYLKLVHGLNGTFDDFCELFMNESTPIGSYWSHVLPFWKIRNEPNILFLKYEDMKRNLPSVIEKCAKFLNINYKITETDMNKICEHLKFDKMQLNPAVNMEPLINNTNFKYSNADGNVKFIRKGEIGDWVNYISDDLSDKFDEWMNKNTNDTGLYFDYK